MTEPVQKRVFRSRTMIRVTSARRRKTVQICLPGWNSSLWFDVARTMFPKKFKLRNEVRFFARANIAAEAPEDLDITGPFEGYSTPEKTARFAKRFDAALAKAKGRTVRLGPDRKITILDD
jgi:hypothetical protein